jgi:protein TonB
MKSIITLCAILSFVTITVYGQNKNSAEKIVCCVEPQPNYPGGLDSLRTFIKLNLIRPRATAEYEGNVYVEFVVNEDGSLTSFKIIRGLCNICDSNAIETLKKMPKWIPAEGNNKAIKSKIIVPVNYGY